MIKTPSSDGVFYSQEVGVLSIDVISENGVMKLLDEEIKSKVKLDIRETVGSTNDEVKALAIKGESEGYLLVSRSQTKGKGRLGRSFFSPDGTGIYMSLLLRPECKAEETTLITTAAAVAVCGALQKIGASDPQIKWVNDIFLNGKKVCGILTEAGFGSKGNVPDYVVLGVGVNMYAPENDFPEELKGIAGAAFAEEKEGLCNRFIAEFLNAFFNFYETLSQRTHIADYREKCFVIGKEISVISGDVATPAIALDIDNNCNLIVQYSDGTKTSLGTGEISIRLTN